MENEAHSQRAKPRQRPQDLSWRWKLVENPDCLHGLPSRPQRRNNTNFTLRSLLETLIHKDNHCQPPFIYCKSQVPQESIQGFFKRKIKKHMRMLAGPGPAEPLSSRLHHALPRAPCIRICNLLARTVTGLLPPAPGTWALGMAAAQPSASPQGCGDEFPLFLASRFFFFSSFYLTVQKDLSCLLLFLNLNFFNLHFYFSCIFC